MRLLSIIVFTVVLISNTFGQTTPTTQVKTIADLVALRIPTINNRLSALVTGRVTENDGGGGVFFYDGSDATSTNNRDDDSILTRDLLAWCKEEVQVHRFAWRQPPTTNEDSGF